MAPCTLVWQTLQHLFRSAFLDLTLSYPSSTKSPLFPWFVCLLSYSDLEHIGSLIISWFARVGGTFTVTRNLGIGFTVPYALQ